MKNCVVSGRFKGRRIIARRGVPVIVLGLGQSLPLTDQTVARMQVVHSHRRPSAVSGWGRGLVGSLLGRTMQFAAIQSARRIHTFYCRLQFRDGSTSLIRLEERMFLTLSAAVEMV